MYIRNKRRKFKKKTQLINNKYLDDIILNKEIEKEMLIIFNGQIKSLINREKQYNYLTFKFQVKGIYLFYFISENYLTDISYMFCNCSSLTNIDLSSFNTKNVINMKSFLRNCILLEKVNLSSFNTNKVINMSYMFGNCSSLKDIDLSSFNTSQVKNMENMFFNCNSLKEINVSKFNTNKVKTMWGMFDKCSSLKKIIFSDLFTTRNTEDISFMFHCCKQLEKLDLSSFEAYNLTNISFLFSYCTLLKQLDLSSFYVNIDYLKSRTGVFFGCTSLNHIVCDDDFINQLFRKELKRKNKNILNS